MDELLKLAKTSRILRPFSSLDVLLLYGVCAPHLKDFLHNRELASKIHIPGFRNILKRGTKLEPLYIEELIDTIDEEFLMLRSRYHLRDVESKLSPTQRKVWRYFVPRKYVEFFYATNGEVGRTISRVYFDVDRGRNTTFEQALEVTKKFLENLKASSLTNFTKDILVSWTGNSFHIELNLKEEQDLSFYNKYLTTREGTETIVKKLVDETAKQVNVKLLPEHERAENAITIDPSQTPPGKLDRVPLGCLHLNRTTKEIDGVSLPVKEEWLFTEKIFEITKYMPDDLIANLSDFIPIERFYVTA